MPLHVSRSLPSSGVVKKDATRIKSSCGRRRSGDAMWTEGWGMEQRRGAICCGKTLLCSNEASHLSARSEKDRTGPCLEGLEFWMQGNRSGRHHPIVCSQSAGCCLRTFRLCSGDIPLTQHHFCFHFARHLWKELCDFSETRDR